MKEENLLQGKRKKEIDERITHSQFLYPARIYNAWYISYAKFQLIKAISFRLFNNVGDDEA